MNAVSERARRIDPEAFTPEEWAKAEPNDCTERQLAAYTRAAQELRREQAFSGLPVTLTQAIEQARQMQVDGRYINGRIFHLLADEIERLQLALRPFQSPPLYVFDAPADTLWVPMKMPEHWIGGGQFSTLDFRRAKFPERVS